MERKKPKDNARTGAKPSGKASAKSAGKHSGGKPSRHSAKPSKQPGGRAKPLPPTMRGKKRYIFFRLGSEQPLNEREVSISIFKEFSYLFGSLGLSKMNLQLMEFNPFAGQGILRCSRERQEEAKSGLLFLKSVSGMAVRPSIVKVSGTLEKLRK